MKILIGERLICSDSRPYFIADIASNHDGEIERALELIELAKEAGADAAKFQHFKAPKIVSRKGFIGLGKLAHQTSWKKSVFEIYEDASVPDEWNEILKQKCDEVGIEYMTSAYDMESLDKADPYLNAYKIGSGDITWTDMLEHIAKKGKPVLLATGASNITDVVRAYDCIKCHNSNIVIMQCNTNYTANPYNFKHINLKVLSTYKKMFPGCILGLSDHTFGYTTVLGAFSLGARIFEKHFTDDNGREGPDHKFSMNPSTWREMITQISYLYDAMGDGIKRIEKNEVESSIVQRRGLYMARDLKKGSPITRKDIFPLRPMCKDAIPPYKADEIIGRRLNIDKERDSYLRWGELE